MADTEQVEEIYEHEMEKNSSPVLTDFLRMIGGTDSMSYKVLVSDIAKAIVEQYKGSSLAGSAQSIKTAIDSLNSNLKGKFESVDNLTIASGAVQFNVSGMDVESKAIVCQKRVTGATYDYVFTPQCAKNTLTVYVRKGNNTTPSDGTQISLFVFWQ